MAARKSPLLIFDVGGVLLQHDALELKDAMLVRCANQQIAGLVWKTIVESGDLSKGRSTVQQLHGELSTNCGHTLDWPQFVRLWNSFFFADLDTMDLITALSTRHRIVLLSNTNAEHWSFMRNTFPVLDYFHHAYLSFQLKLAKPDSEIYQAVMAAEGVDACSCIFFDDSVVNLAGASALGIDAVLCKGMKDVKAALQQRKLNPL